MRVDSVYSDPKPGRKDATCQMVHELWWWWKAEINRGSTCISNRTRRKTHKLCWSKCLNDVILSLYMQFDLYRTIWQVRDHQICNFHCMNKIRQIFSKYLELISIESTRILLTVLCMAEVWNGNLFVSFQFCYIHRDPQPCHPLHRENWDKVIFFDFMWLYFSWQFLFCIKEPRWLCVVYKNNTRLEISTHFSCVKTQFYSKLKSCDFLKTFGWCFINAML